jgi:uncharacterized protein
MEVEAPVRTVTSLLAVRNVAEPVLPASSYVPVNLAVAGGLLAIGRTSGLSWNDLGLDPGRLSSGTKAGAPVAALAALGLGVAAAVPATRPFFDDDRVEIQRGRGELLRQTAWRIPVGTVVFEEFAFRGVLLGLLRRRFSPLRSVAIDSALFGLWHIVPTLRSARRNDVAGGRLLALVAGSVVATGVAGVLFCLLRIAGGHLAAPALTHLAVNDSGYLLAWSHRVRSASEYGAETAVHTAMWGAHDDDAGGPVRPDRG